MGNENKCKMPNFLFYFIYWCEPMSEVLPSMVFLSRQSVVARVV